MDGLLVCEVAERKARQQIVDARDVDLALKAVAHFLRCADDRNAGVDSGVKILRDRIVLQGIVVDPP